MKNDNRYILFAGDDYYPVGGAKDIVGVYHTIDKAIEAHNPKKYDYDGGWANILDIEKMSIVRCFGEYKWCDNYEDLEQHYDNVYRENMKKNKKGT